MAVNPPTAVTAAAIDRLLARLPQVSRWHLALAAVAVVYGIVLRVTRDSLIATTGLLPNAWDQLAGLLSDPYLVSSFVLPLWLLRSATTNHAYAQPHVLLRCGSRLAWLASSYRRSLVDAAGFVAFLLLAGIATSFAMGWEPVWSPLALEPALADFTVHPLTNLGFAPPVMALAQALFLSIGLAGVASVLSAVRLAVPANVWQYTATAVIWLVTMLTFRMPTGCAPINLADGLLLHVAVGDYGSVPAAAVAVAWLPAVVFGQQALRSRLGRLRLPRTRVLAFGLGSAGLLLVAVAASSATTVDGVVFETLFGGGYGQTQLWRYAAFALLSLVPAWLYAAHLNDVFQGPVHTELIRHRSPLTWWSTRLGRWQLIATGFAAAAFTLTTLTAATGLGQHTYDIPGPPLLLQLYQYVVNGALQACLYLLIVFLARWITGHEAAPLVATGLMMALGAPPLNPAAWLPLMLNSLAYAEYGWPTVLHITAQLAAADLIAAAATVLALTRCPRLRERNL